MPTKIFFLIKCCIYQFQYKQITELSSSYSCQTILHCITLLHSRTLCTVHESMAW